MTYQEKFVAAVKCNGAILREKDGTVTIPFDSEYTIFLKNLDSRDALVKVSIDGEDVLGGNNLIIKGNSSSEIKGFIKKEKFKNKFKFIQKTKLSLALGQMTDEPDDGIIRIEYTFTKKIPEEITKFVNDVYVTKYHYPIFEWPWWNKPNIYYPIYPKFDYNNTIIGSSIQDSKWTTSSYMCSSINGNITSEIKTNKNSEGENSIIYRDIPEPNNDEGKTVKGSKINEKLKKSFIGELENNSNVIIIKLRGTIKKEKIIANESGTKTSLITENVENAITSKDKIYCIKCGKANKSNANYCSRCGTKLEL